MAVTPLTLVDLEAEEQGPIWVLNTASYSEHVLEGNVLLRILPQAAGKGAYATIPMSWLPFEITSKFSRKQILESTEFRSALHENLLTAISAKDANAMLHEDGAREEKKRLRDFDNRVQAARDNRPQAGEIAMAGEKSNVTPTQVVGPASTYVPASVQGSQMTPNERFIALFDKLKASDDMTAVNLYRMQGANLSRNELRYLRDNLPHMKLGKAIRSRLSEMAAAKKAREAAAGA